jgi:hypothetical protein
MTGDRLAITALLMSQFRAVSESWAAYTLSITAHAWAGSVTFSTQAGARGGHQIWPTE